MGGILDDASPESLGIGGTVPAVAEPEPEYGEQVHAMLAAAAGSPRVRMQSLGIKAQTALDNLAAALKREQKIAAAEAELARLKRGED